MLTLRDSCDSVTRPRNLKSVNFDFVIAFAVPFKSKSLKFNPDGSLTLYYQHQSPGPDKETNWVPAPEDEFSLYIRAYWPKAEILEGRWTPPPVEQAK